MDVEDLRYSLDHERLLDTLAATDDLLIVQDLDGVCMELVRDPLDRRIAPRYVQAARELDGGFYVLTNGEHIGRRGVNGIVEAACGGADRVRAQQLYLPGLAGGGVQWQDRAGAVAHPGVSDAELAFLRGVPARMRAFLQVELCAPEYRLDAGGIDSLLDAAVLDNLVSPTLNLNHFFARFGGQDGRYRRLQTLTGGLMDALLAQAADQQLGDAFFVHYAPNLGRDADGAERIKPAADGNSGTHDFQFMLRGAIKETGVLALLNRHYQHRSGRYPLGAQFSVRDAPRDLDALLQLARESFDPALMPRIVGVGDTVTAQPGDDGVHQRGGSDRGFLTLIQQLGAHFGSGNLTLYVDSSGGELPRPGIDADALRAAPAHPWPALRGISDAADPLQLNALFPGGHAQYVDFFCRLAQRRRAG